MNKQEIFDTVLAHARWQGKKSDLPPKNGMVNRHNLYRHPYGLKCFIGILIQDKEYHPQWETMDIMMVLDDYRCPQTLLSRLDPKNNQFLLEDLQNLHDREEVKDWEQGFRRIAGIHDLQYTAP
jgi:hypothetical protein